MQKAGGDDTISLENVGSFSTGEIDTILIGTVLIGAVLKAK